MVPATQAASRLRMNSKPSLDMRVTYGEEEAVIVVVGTRVVLLLMELHDRDESTRWD